MADLVTQVALLADVDAKVTTNGANENTGARVNANLHNIVDTLWNHAGIAGGHIAGRQCHRYHRS